MGAFYSNALPYPDPLWIQGFLRSCYSVTHRGGGVRAGHGTLTPLRCLDKVSHLIGIWLLEDSVFLWAFLSFLNVRSVIILSLLLLS